ncbi:protein SMG5-like isoform X1 [Branchiostoma floridae]|uniref:Protein SMG5-like isoform X1 n=1 Tax=Branchiostoma floridae TaxID=7739 RepID=A0A9J7HGH7_BRAFL|nr:protein SMG5-like isoform X1 [Branchiostoma floridae]
MKKGSSGPSKAAVSMSAGISSVLAETKRIYRSILDAIHRLDDGLRDKRAYKEVFQVQNVALRNRLKELCERLMFLQPADYGRKAEDLLWRKVFYDVIQVLKQNKRHVRQGSSVECAFRTHLSAATGFYTHLMLRLQGLFQVTVWGVCDWPDLADPLAGKPHVKSQCQDEKVREWAKRACHRCLIYLGDLARYQQEFDGMRSEMMAARYYHQAIAMYPDFGMPHNQLGTLAGTSNHGVDAAYHYMRCLSTISPFEGAAGNIQHLLEKNRKQYNQLPSEAKRDLPPHKQRSKDVKRLIITFLYLQEMLHPDFKANEQELAKVCRAVLEDFNLCMFYIPPSENHSIRKGNNRGQWLDDGLVFKMVIMCLMAIHSLQISSSPQMSAAVAFTLALSSHLLNHTNTRLQTALYEAEHPQATTLTSQDQDIDETKPDMSIAANEDNHSQALEDVNLSGNDYIRRRPRGEDNRETKKKGAAPSKKRRKKLTKLQQFRRRRRHDSGSDLSDEDLSEDELLSVSESSETSDSDESTYSGSGSESDSDSADSLMESQELQPGFTDESKTPEACNSPQSILSQSSEEHDVMDKNDKEEGHQTKESRMSESKRSPELKDMSPEMFQSVQNPSLLRRNIRLAPSFDALRTSESPGEGADRTHNNVAHNGNRDLAPAQDEVINHSIQTPATIAEPDNEDEDIDSGSEEDNTVCSSPSSPEEKLSCLLKVLTNQGLLPTIKVICDWLKYNTHIIRTCAQSSQSLWTRLATLLNMLPHEAQLCVSDICVDAELGSMLQGMSQKDWIQHHPLPEDVQLRSVPALDQSHRRIIMDVRNMKTLTAHQQTLLRVCCIQNFGHFLADLKVTPFQFDSEQGLFLGPSDVKELKNQRTRQEQAELQARKAEEESRRNQLMRDMAQLRLQSEVHQLEGSLQVTGQALSPYLVPDAGVLCDHMTIIKQLAASARFIIIIPRTVIDQLDVLKKESQQARDAIRILGMEFKKGNRYLRAQKDCEQVKGGSSENRKLRRQDMNAWHFYKMVDCCRYFAGLSTECDPSGMVTILSSFDPTDTMLSERLQSAITSAKEAGIEVGNVLQFFSSWKSPS